MKRNLPLIIGTSLLILLPSMGAGIWLWDVLPDPMATHFGFQGMADGYSSKVFAVFGIPVMLTALHLLCLFFTSRDPRNQEQNEKVQALVCWIVPFVSLITTWMVFSANLGQNRLEDTPMVLLLGVIFMALGNWLPKVTRNSTIGIRLPWTLEDDEIWDKTHRLGGKVWVLGGLAMVIDGFAGFWMEYFMLAVIVVMVGVPVGYSFLLSVQKKNG